MLENARDQINSKVKEASIPLIVALSLLVGILVGVAISSYQFPSSKVQLASKKYNSVLQLIDKEYVDSVQINKIFEDNVSNLLADLDPHSSYVPAEDYMTKAILDSDFEGIGIRYFYLRDTLFVAESIKGGPSEKGGVRAGDRILQAGDSSLIGIEDVNRIYSILRGESNSEVTLKVFRNSTQDTLRLKIKRNKIPNLAADLAFMVNPETGYIRLNRFSNNAHLELEKQITDLVTGKNASQLILDLRNNGGGYMHAAEEICDMFLPMGSDILYTVTRGAITSKKIAGNHGKFEHLPLIILINENSASASEIVSGALQDNDRALILGRRSYGKGLVQTPFSLVDGSELRLTTSRYHTPSGRCIQKPYDLDGFNYEDDYLSRLKSGELFREDSVQKNDSLKYHTLNKRTVYGGGGVYPDVFVPEDTSANSILLRNLYNEQIFTEFGILYSSQNKDRLSKYTLDEFVANYEAKNWLLNKCLLFASKHSIEIKKRDLKRSLPKIKLEIKAHIAESIWGAEGMHRTLSLEDNFILRATEVFPEINERLAPSR